MKKKNALVKVLIVLCILALVALNVYAFWNNNQNTDVNSTPEQTQESNTSGTEDSSDETTTAEQESNSDESSSEQQESETSGPIASGNYIQNVDPNTPSNFEVAPPFECSWVSTGDALLDEANRQALMYDYDKAIALLEGSSDYANNKTYQDAVATYTKQKEACLPWEYNNQITHIFFHSLVVDVDTAFASSKADDYNDVMTTVCEFVKMMQEMYDKGYVLVSLYDLAEMQVQADGTEKMVRKYIYLPEGKKPFILSQDDVSYYEYMTGHGFASRFVIDEKTGKVINEMDLKDGTVLRGSYDMVPILEDFIEAHPDFCYRGARGTIALTGYDGIFGYRTSDFWYNPNCDYYISNEKNDYNRVTHHTFPNNNIEADKQTAIAIANRLKEMGWTFASHSWGHPDLAAIDWGRFTWDTDLWEIEVEPLIGDTDIIIFPKGADVGSWRGYEEDNERYQYLKNAGFDYFCNVDSAVYFVQRTDNYLRTGRRNLDGRRLFEAILTPEKNKLGDLFDDINSIICPDRCEWKE